MSIATRMGWVSVFEENRKIFKIKFGRVKENTKSVVLKKFKKNLLKYYNSKTFEIKCEHKIIGNSIQKKVWNELKKIKFGHTKTYGDIAKKFKLSPGHVGKICGQNKLPLLIPCHRVIRSDGTLGGFSSVGGVNLKKKLLQFEKRWK